MAPADLRDDVQRLLQSAAETALALIEAGDPDGAVAHLAGQGGMAATKGVACYGFGLLCVRAGRLQPALSWFDRAIGLEPGDMRALQARAAVLQDLGRPDEALATLDRMIRLQPRDAGLRCNIGIVLRSLGRSDEALAAFEEAQRLAADPREALIQSGLLLAALKRPEAAITALTRAASLRPDEDVLTPQGISLHGLGRDAEAVAVFEAAAALRPLGVDTELKRGQCLVRLGRYEDAIGCYERAGQQAESDAQPPFLKGIALKMLGRLPEALAAYDAALLRDSRFCQALCNRGTLLHEFGSVDDALAAYAGALAIDAGFLPAHLNCATIHHRAGRHDEALPHCRAILRRDADHAPALNLLGAILHEHGEDDEALAALDRAITAKPDLAEAWLNRGNVLRARDDLDAAILAYGEALRRNPHGPDALSNLGVARLELAQVDEALACFDQALTLRPDFPNARANRAGALLLKGRLQEGFADYESRWERTKPVSRLVTPPAPQWDGQDLAGKKIFVYDEQGLGDLMQFARYLPLLVDRGADVAFLCRPGMRRLLGKFLAGVRLVEAPDPEARYDFASALLSLPRGFRTELDSIPAAQSYLRPDPHLAALWATQLGSQGFRIGVCWRGNMATSPKRSFPSACLAPLAAIQGVRLISLVKDERPEEIGTAHDPWHIESAGPTFDRGPDAFVDCAAIISHLDLIVTSDTAIAHLAGALGVPVFLALRQAGDWRWLLDRSDSPWYPTMRLFRQTRRDVWAPVFDEIAKAVAALRVTPASDAAPREGSAVPTHGLMVPAVR